MISQSTVEQFCTLLMKIIYQEQRIDSAREVLAEQAGFEPYAAFQRIDRNKNGIVRAQHLHQFLEENQFDVSLEDINIYVEHFDEEKKGGLYYYEFLRNLLPFKNVALRSEISQKETFQVRPDERLPYKIEYAICTVIKKTILYIKDLEPDKIQLNSTPDFSIRLVFSLIDKSNRGYIDHGAFRDFLDDNGYDLEDVEIQMLVTSFDFKFDNKIDQYEFLFGLQPRYAANKQQMIRESYLNSPMRRSRKQLSDKQLLTHSSLASQTPKKFMDEAQTTSKKNHFTQNLLLSERDQASPYLAQVYTTGKKKTSTLMSPRSAQMSLCTSPSSKQKLKQAGQLPRKSAYRSPASSKLG